MPTYQYHCVDCGRDLEAVQKFTDPSLTECPTCQGHLRKVFSPVGVVFKGSGFYATDNRTRGKTEATKTGESSSGDAKALNKAETKAALPKAASKPALGKGDAASS